MRQMYQCSWELFWGWGDRWTSME